MIKQYTVDDLTESQREVFNSYSSVISLGLISNLELQWLLTLIYSAPERRDIMEIGCHLGGTTQAIAKEFLSSHVYAVDCVKSHIVVNQFQYKETPSWNDVCSLARDMENVTYINTDTSIVMEFFVPPKVGIVFIDGGHIYNEVQWNTIACWQHKRRLIYHNATMDIEHPWIEVYKYLDDMNHFYPDVTINLIKDTTLAFIDCP